MMRGTLVGALLVVVGCGSGNPSPKAPEEPTVAETPKSADDPEPASSASAAPDEAAAAPAPSADAPEPESLSPDDLTKVLQATLDDPELTGYLHLEKPGRSHVKLAGPNLPKDLKLVKGSYGVTIVDAPKSPKDPVIVLTRITPDGKSVTVAYTYDVEGIRGTTRVKNGTSGWQLASSRIIER